MDALSRFPFMNGISDTRRSNQENTWVDDAVKDIRIDGNQVCFCAAIKAVHLKCPKLKIVDEVEDDCTNYHQTNSNKSSSSCYKISFSVSTRKIIIYIIKSFYLDLIVNAFQSRFILIDFNEL